MAKFKDYEVFETKDYYGNNWFLKATAKKTVDANFLGGHNEVYNLEGFQDIQNLNSLTFIDHPKVDLSAIKNNKSIKNLILQNTEVSDISFITNLTSLEILSLEGTKITDLQFLRNLKSLKLLYINNTKVSDISVLSNLKNLQVLDISETTILDISPIVDLPKLHTLHVQYSLVRNLEKIANKPFYELLIDEAQNKLIRVRDLESVVIHESYEPDKRKQGHFKYPFLWKSLYRWLPEKLRNGQEHLESQKNRNRL